MPDLSPVAGAKFYIGPATDTKLADFTEAEFDAITGWVEVDGFETMGPVGDSAQTISTDLINRGRTTKQKGTRDAGSMDNRFAVTPGDAGQDAMYAAEQTRQNFAFQIVFDDSLGTNGTTRSFIGLVTTAQEPGGQANTIRMTQFVVEVNSNVVTKAAA